eukprot:gene20640-26759_t
MLVRSNRNHLLALDDLTKHFEQCRLNNCPAVIVLYDLHSFASTKKQTLIYTLLDLMHKKELFFIIIGTSSCAFLDSLLEKRIISRLNAQHIFIPTTTTIDIINELSHRLVLSETLEIFVIDSSDRRKFEKSYLLLQTILQQEKLFYIPIVILANKNDNIYSCQVKDLSSALNLHNIRDRQWTVISSSTKTGDGISEGVDFLYNHMIEVIH